MRLFRNKIALVLLGLLILILIVVIPLIVFLVLAEQKEHMPWRLTPTPRGSQTPGGSQSLPVSSRNIPVFASSTNYPASDANSGNYNISWRPKGTPAWLAYDLSCIPVVERSKVLLYGIRRHMTKTRPSLGTMLTICRKITRLTFIQAQVAANRQAKNG